MGRIFVPPSVGRVTAGELRDGLFVPSRFFRNQVVYEGVDLLARIVAGQDLAINTMYIEFVNSGSASPTVDPAQGREYYDDLEATGVDTDYLRIPLQLIPALDSSDPDRFASDVVIFTGITGDSTGVSSRALPFDEASSSEVYGVALVCAVDDERTNDIVFSRGYPSSAIPKGVNQLAIRWSHTFSEGNLLE